MPRAGFLGLTVNISGLRRLLPRATSPGVLSTLDLAKCKIRTSYYSVRPRHVVSGLFFLLGSSTKGGSPRVALEVVRISTCLFSAGRVCLARGWTGAWSQVRGAGPRRDPTRSPAPPRTPGPPSSSCLESWTPPGCHLHNRTRCRDGTSLLLRPRSDCIPESWSGREGGSRRVTWDSSRLRAEGTLARALPQPSCCCPEKEGHEGARCWSRPRKAGTKVEKRKGLPRQEL